MNKPFAGIRILDFTRYVAGPFGTYQFALLGAEVIKVEPKAGDDMRRSSPVRWEGSAQGLGPSFLGINSNKRSITLDLSKPAAIEIAKRLATDADIVWENFRPGIMERFGLGYETLREINPRLIYCAVSGFGQNGPERGTAAFDGKLQAMSGIMSITGHEDKRPTRAGLALCDTLGALTASFAGSSALRRDLADFRNRAPPAARASRRAAACRGIVRRIHPGRLRLSPRRGRHRQHRPPAPSDRRTHRRDPARGRLWRGRDRRLPRRGR